MHYQSFNANTIILARNEKNTRNDEEKYRDDKNTRKHEKKYRDEIDIEIGNRDEKTDKKIDEKFISASRVKKIMHINNALNAPLNQIQNYK